MCDTYPTVTQETNGAQLSGYSINSPPLQRKATAQSPVTDKLGGTELASPTVQDVHFRRLGGNRKARESFNRLSVEFEADTPEDAKTYTERFASAKALFENMTRSPMPAIESANRQNRIPFKSRIVNANSKQSPPVVPMKPVHLTRLSPQESKTSPTSLLANGDIADSHRLPAVASNLNRLLPDSPTRKRVSESDTSQDGNVLEELGPRQSPDGQAAPDDSSSINSSSANNVEPPFFEPSLNFQKSSSQESSNLGAIGEADVKDENAVVTEVISTMQNLENNDAEIEPAVYGGTVQEKFVPIDTPRPESQQLEEVDEKSAVEETRDVSEKENDASEIASDKNVVDHVVPKAIADDLLKDDTETENDDSNSVNEDEYDLGNEAEAPDEVAMPSSEANLDEKDAEDSAVVMTKGPQKLEDEEEGSNLATEERVLDEEEQMWWDVYEGLLDVDEIDGLPPAEEDELVVEDDQMTRKKTLRFSDQKIKVSYTYSMHELDRRNDQIDPVGASAEYELEKRIDKMTLFEVELDKTNSGLGLSIIGMGVGADAGVEKLGIFIKVMNPNGAAAQSGKLAVGDMIIEVNGQSLVGVTQVFAASVLKSTENVVRFLLGREQENGEISRLLQQEEQAAAAAAHNSAQYRAANVNQSHHGPGDATGSTHDESSMLPDGLLLDESVEDLSPTTENFEKLKILYQYIENSRSVEQEEREHALMQLDRVQAERDELGGRVVPRLEAQLTSVQDQLHQTLQRLEEVTERKDEVEKKYQKAKRIIRDLNSESNEMKDHLRSVKEQMSVMKEDFQQENFTLHERIATLEAQLVQSQQQVTQLQNEAKRAQDLDQPSQADVPNNNSTDSTLGPLSFTNITGLLPENETTDFQSRTMNEARNRNSYVESQFNQVIQLLETRPSRVSRYEDACISDDEILDGPSNRNSNRYSRPISGMSAGTNSTSAMDPSNHHPSSAQTNPAAVIGANSQHFPGAVPFESDVTSTADENNRASNMTASYAQQPATSAAGSGSQGIKKTLKKLTFANCEPPVNGENEEEKEEPSMNESMTDLNNTTSAASTNYNTAATAVTSSCSTFAPSSELNLSCATSETDGVLETSSTKRSLVPSPRCSQQSLPSPVGGPPSSGGTGGGGGSMDLSLQKYKARLVKNSRLMARRLLPSRHRYKNSFLSRSYKQDNSDSSSTGSGSYGSAQRPQNFPVGVGSSPLAFQHESQNSAGSSKSFTDRLRSSFTKQGKYVVNSGSPSTPPASASYATSSPLEPHRMSLLNDILPDVTAIEQKEDDTPDTANVISKGPRDGAAGFPNKYQARDVEIDGSRKISTGSNSALDQPPSAYSPLSTNVGAPTFTKNHVELESPSVNETDVKQMLYKLNLSKYYPVFQRNHIDGNNLSELAHGDRLKDLGISDKKDRDAIKHHIKERNKLINKDSKLKSKGTKKISAGVK